MILIFASSYSRSDPQTELLVKKIQDQGKRTLVINPLIPQTYSELSLTYKSDGKVGLYIKKRKINPRVLFLSRLIRSDCIASIPKNCFLPTIYREKVGLFFNEIINSFSFQEFFPGNLENINRAETKIALFRMAVRCGLRVPKSSTVSFLARPGYRKVLGHPFSISFDKKMNGEVGITIFNGEDNDPLGLPWIYQTKIDQLQQIRSVFIEGEFRFYKSEWSQFSGKDMREVQETEDLKWTHTEIPKREKECLLKLCKELRIRFACPEFLVNKKGEYVFIDLNPCGDWYGFIDDEENNLVATSIAKKL